MGEYTTNIGIKNGLYERLKDRKSPGQSFSGVIEEVLMKAEKYEKLDEDVISSVEGDAQVEN